MATWSILVGRSLNPNLGLLERRMLLSTSDTCSEWGSRGGGGMHAAAGCLPWPRLCMSITLSITAAASLKLEGSKGQSGKNAKVGVGTGEQCARHVEVIHSDPHWCQGWDSRGWCSRSEVCSQVIPLLCAFSRVRVLTTHGQVVKELPHTGDVTGTTKDHISFPDCRKGN